MSKGEYRSIMRVFCANKEDYFRFGQSIIMSIVYDYEVAPHHDRYVELFERGNTLALESLTPEAACILETFPFCEWLSFIFLALYVDLHTSA